MRAINSIAWAIVGLAALIAMVLVIASFWVFVLGVVVLTMAIGVVVAIVCGIATCVSWLRERLRALQRPAQKHVVPRPRSFWTGVVTHENQPIEYADRDAIRGWAGLHDPHAEMDLAKINCDRVRLKLPIFVLPPGAS